MVEMIVISFVTLLLLFAIVQFALLYNAKTVLNYAAYEAARIGALNYSHPESMRLALAQKLAVLEPIDSSATSSAYDKLVGQREAFITNFDSKACIRRLNPTNSSGGHWSEAHKTPQSTHGIANDHLLYRDPTAKGANVQSIQDANLLKISVTYCPKMMVPIVSQVIQNLMLIDRYELLPDKSFTERKLEGYTPSGLKPFNKQCYEAGRFPMVASAMMRMQTPVGNYGFTDSDCEDITTLAQQLSP
jgi:hypothetical protein